MSDPNSPRPIGQAADDVATAASPSDLFARPVQPRVSVDRIPRIFGRYRIEECLGKGGMGAVFRAHDTGLDRLVALKVPFLSDDDVETQQRFYREARAAATLQHANICPVFDVGEFQNIPYLTMAFIEGRSLSAAVSAGQNFSFTQIALLVRKLALAMQEAHTRGVIHRDLKPANILLRPNGEPVITDFGLARRTDDKQSTGLTQEGDILGTLDYMAPEQAEGDHDAVGPLADIYALGVILYELLCGQRPFKGNTAAMIVQILQKEPARPRTLRSDIPPGLEQICLKAMAKKPAERFPTMTHFAAALADYLRSLQHGSTSAARPTATIQPSAGPVVNRVVPATNSPAKNTIATTSRETEHPSTPRSGPRTGSKPKRPGKRRKSDSTLALKIVLAAVFAGAALIVTVVSAITFWPRSESPQIESAAAPPIGRMPMHPSGPPSGISPSAPSGFRPGSTPLGPASQSGNDQPTQPKVAPGPGFEVRLEPDRLSLMIGQQQTVALKLDRKDYQGAVSIRWTAPAGLKVVPAGPITLKPGQPDPTLKLMAVTELPESNFHIDLNAVHDDDSKRPAVTTSLMVELDSSGPCIRVVEPNLKPNFAVHSIAFTADFSVVLIGGGTGPPPPGPPGPGGAQDSTAGLEGNAIQVVSPERGEVFSTLPAHRDRVMGLGITDDGKTALSWSADDTFALWDLATGKRRNHAPKTGLKISGAAIYPDGKRAVLLYAGPTVYNSAVTRVNLDTFQVVSSPLSAARLVGSSAPADVLRCAAVSIDHRTIVGGLDGKLLLLEPYEKGRPGSSRPVVMMGHEEAVNCVAFSTNGKLAVTGCGGVMQAGTLQRGRANSVCLWEVGEQSPRWRREAHPDVVTCVAFSGDGHLIATGSADGEIKVWSVEDGRELHVLPGHTGRILGLAFVEGSRQLWSGSADQSLRLWRLR